MTTLFYVICAGCIGMAVGFIAGLIVGTIRPHIEPQTSMHLDPWKVV